MTGALIDPLEASWALLDLMEGRAVPIEPLRGLAFRLDAFSLSMHHPQMDEVAFIESVDVEFPPSDDHSVRQRLSQQFSDLGNYWMALSSMVRPGAEPEIGSAHAINDLLDITKELREIRFLFQNHGRQEALAGLRFRYRSHIRMHILPLRCHLEDVIFEGKE